MDVEKIPAAITPSTRAIIPVDTFGNPGGMIELEQLAQQHELILIEDACDGLGGQIGQRRIGGFGRAAAFSFYPNRQITTGEGGMLVTDDDNLAAVCQSLRNQGRDETNWLGHERLGYNYRLSEINAALGVAQMERLEETLEARRRIAHHYMQRLMANRFLILPTLGDQTLMSWFVFVVRLNDLFDAADRDQILQELRGAGIGCGHYFLPLHLQPYLSQRMGHHRGAFPISEYVADRTIALPFFTRMTPEQVNRVCDEMETILDRRLLRRGGRL